MDRQHSRRGAEISNLGDEEGVLGNRRAAVQAIFEVSTEWASGFSGI